MMGGGLMGWGGSGGMGLLGGGLFMVFFWVVLIVGAVIGVRWLWSQGQGPWGPGAPGGETPVEILKRRYARGEIDREEFEAKKRDLA